MTQNPRAIKLGELMIRAEVLTSQQLLEAIEYSKQTSMPVGKMFVMCGIVTENVLYTAVQLQSMVRDNQVSLDNAVSLLTLVHKQNISLEQAMAQSGGSSQSKEPTFKLGEILYEAGFLGADELEKFLKDGQESGLPLGRIILLYGSISKEMLSAALTAQVLVRDGKVSREQAIKALKTTRRRRTSLEASLKELGFYTGNPRPHALIGELFIKSGLIDEADLLSALELALEQEIPVGRALIQKKFVTQPDLEIALKLQEMVINATLTDQQAAEILNKVSKRGFSPTSALTELALSSATTEDCKILWQLLTASGTVHQDARPGVFTKEDIGMAEMGHNLLHAELIDELTLHSACRCQFLMRNGFLDLQRAIVVLNHCRTRRISADDALRELSWIAKTQEEIDASS